MRALQVIHYERSNEPGLGDRAKPGRGSLNGTRRYPRWVAQYQAPVQRPHGRKQHEVFGMTDTDRRWLEGFCPIHAPRSRQVHSRTVVSMRHRGARHQGGRGPSPLETPLPPERQVTMT